jgi:hypothetical protein
LNHYIVYMAKRLVIFAPNFTKKIHFCMHHQWHLFLLCWFEYNDSYLCLWQGLLVLFERMVVNEHHFAQNASTWWKFCQVLCSQMSHLYSTCCHGYEYVLWSKTAFNII